MAFVFNPAQLLRLRKAVYSYNAAVKRMAASGKYDVVPNPTTMARERELISNARDLSTRIKQLRRVLTTVKKGSQNVVTFKGIKMPKYMKDEIRNIVRDLNKERKQLREELFPDWDELSPRQRATAQSDRNLNDLHEEDYTTAEDFDDLNDEKYPNMPRQAEIYIDTWLNNGENPEIPKLIREMAQCEYGFKLLMESPDIEKEVRYIYPDDKNTPYKEPYSIRISKATQYWLDMYADYNAHTGYFTKC